MKIRSKQVVPDGRNYSAITLAANTARTPGATRDVLVIITFNQVSIDGETTTGNVQVDNSGGGTFTTIAVVSQSPNVTGLGVGITLTTQNSATFICPKGSKYKWTASGTGVTTITNINEVEL